MGGEQKNATNRIESGIARLDYILKGGFLKGGTYTLLGPPGCGKTIFANQFCFNQIRLAHAKCLYVTLLSESVAKMIRHLSSMSFFNEEFIPDQMYYVSGYKILKEEGLKGLLTLITESSKQRQPSLLILDSVDAALDLPKGQCDFREFLHEFQAMASLLNTTSLLISSHSSDRARHENASVDGVLELTDTLVGPRAVRELTVHKFRGSDYLRGRHEVEITKDGVQIHPRTEIQFDKPSGEAVEERARVPFGIERLDRMMEGGPLTGSATALIGAPGTGKTMMGLTYLVEGAKRGDRGVYFGFYEPPPRLIEKARNIGLPLEEYIQKGLIELLWQPPLEHYMDSLAEQLLEKIRAERKDERRRLFIDGIEGFRAAAIYPDRMPRFLSAFFNQLRMLDVTTLVTEELGIFEPQLSIPNPELVHVVENAILLRYVELHSQLYRLISVMKMRESKFDNSIREFKIQDEGIVVADSFKSAEAILTGNPRVNNHQEP